MLNSEIQTNIVFEIKMMYVEKEQQRCRIFSAVAHHHHVHVVTNKAVFENVIVFEEIDSDHLLKVHFSQP